MGARDSYDSDQYAQQMRDQICSVIDIYYPANPAPECSGAPTSVSLYLPTVVNQHTIELTAIGSATVVLGLITAFHRWFTLD